MMVPTLEQVNSALAGVVVPRLGKAITDLDVVENVRVDDGAVRLSLRFTVAAYASKSQLKQWVDAAVRQLPGVSSVETLFVSNPTTPTQPQPGSSSRMIELPQVGVVMAVFSGKGGVGKSTVSTNLAVALAQLGEQVGLFDADLHGPSIPKLMGIHDRPRLDGSQMPPLVRHGVKTMSVGMLVKDDEPLIWRGPMITKGINELLETTQWGPLDFLILDLPPGTGDAQLGLAQDVRLDGSVAVTTPQGVAIADVRRGVAAFRKLEVPIWGLVENMAYFICPCCDQETEIFGAQHELEEELPILARLPLDPLISLGGDGGIPIVSSHPRHPASLAIKRLAAQLLDQTV